MKKIKSSLPHNLAFGIARKAAEKELEEWLKKPDTGESISAEHLLVQMNRGSSKES